MKIYYKVSFPITSQMSPISYEVTGSSVETPMEEALWHYNHSRAHDGLRPLDEVPEGTKIEILNKT